MVPSLVSSILAMLFIAAASALRKVAAYHYPGDTASRSTSAGWLIAIGSLLVILLAAIGWPKEEWEAFDMDSLLPRIINAFSTAAALLMEGSMSSRRALGPTTNYPESRTLRHNAFATSYRC
jgi:hypothetical protein